MQNEVGSALPLCTGYTKKSDVPHLQPRQGPPGVSVPLGSWIPALTPVTLFPERAR